jgi:hypothetical protein
MKSTIISVLLSALAGLLTASVAKGQSTEVKLTEKISLSFPQEPKKQEMGPTNLYNLRLGDSTANFIAVASDLQKANGFDAATLAEASLSPEFWDTAADGFVAQMGTDAKLQSREMITIKGYDVMKLTIERPVEKGGVNVLTVYIFVDDVYSINIAHTNRGGKADEKLKKAFFDSITIK